MHAGIYPVKRGALDMFNFVSDSPGERDAIVRTGRLPWWSSPNLELSMMRPLSSALLYLDYAWLGADRAPSRAHIHSMVWWVALLLGASVMLRHLLSPLVASSAILLYALDDAHTLPVAWTANRSELAASALVVWGTCAYLADRRQPRTHIRIFALVLLALGLLAGEYAFAALAYLVAFELAGSSEPLAARLRAIAPVVAMALLYLTVRYSLGYGIQGSSIYIDPLSEPLRFLEACSTRVPLMLGDLEFGFASEWLAWPPPWREPLLNLNLLPASWLSIENLVRFQIWLGYPATALAIGAAAWLSRRSASASQRTLRWLLIGAVMSLVPVSGTIPMSRLLVVASLGFSACLAALFWSLWRVVRTRKPVVLRLLCAACGLVIVSVNGVFAGMLSYADTRFTSKRSYSDEAWTLDAELDRQLLARQHVMILSAPDWNSHFALPYVWHRHGRPIPLSSEVLSTAYEHGLELFRVKENILELGLPKEPTQRPIFLRSGYRLTSMLFHPYDRFSLERYEAMIVETVNGEPIRIRFTFPFSVEDQRYAFLYPLDSGLRRVRLPAVGERVQMPRPAWPVLIDRPN